MAIVALAPNKDGSRLWALWEGADTFAHTERATSRDLIVTLYEIPEIRSDSSRKQEGAVARFGSGDLNVASLSPSKTFRLVLHPNGGARVIRKFFVSKSERTLVVATTRTTAGYSSVDGDLIYTLPDITSFAVSPSQEFLAGGDFREDRPVGVWHADHGKAVFQSSSKGKVIRMAFGTDSQSLQIGWAGGQLENYDLNTGNLVRSLKTSIAPVTMLANGERFVGFLPRSEINGDLVLADIDDGRKVSTLLESCHILTDCVSNPESSFISMSIKGEVKILHQYTAEEAESALKRIDRRVMNFWFDSLSEIYNNRAETSANDLENFIPQ
jgi:WD40 repeat protein